MQPIEHLPSRLNPIEIDRDLFQEFLDLVNQGIYFVEKYADHELNEEKRILIEHGNKMSTLHPQVSTYQDQEIFFATFEESYPKHRPKPETPKYYLRITSVQDLANLMIKELYRLGIESSYQLEDTSLEDRNGMRRLKQLLTAVLEKPAYCKPVIKDPEAYSTDLTKKSPILESEIDDSSTDSPILYDIEDSGRLQVVSVFSTILDKQLVEDLITSLDAIQSVIKSQSIREYSSRTLQVAKSLDQYLVKGTHLFHVLAEYLPDTWSEHNVIQKLVNILTSDEFPTEEQQEYISSLRTALISLNSQFQSNIAVSHNLLSDPWVPVTMDHIDLDEAYKIGKQAIELANEVTDSDDYLFQLIEVKNSLQQVNKQFYSHEKPIIFKRTNQDGSISTYPYLTEAFQGLIDLITEILVTRGKSPSLSSRQKTTPSVGNFHIEASKYASSIDVIPQLKNMTDGTITLDDGTTIEPIIHLVNFSTSANMRSSLQQLKYQQPKSPLVSMLKCSVCGYMMKESLELEAELEVNPDQELPRHHGQEMVWVITEDPEIVATNYRKDTRAKLETALRLKESSRLKDKSNAMVLLEEINNDDKVEYPFKIHALLSLCELNLYELKASEDDLILEDIDKHLTKLKTIATENELEFLILELHILESKIALIMGDLIQSNQKIKDAMNYIATTRMEKYQDRVEDEHKLLEQQIEKWKEMLDLNSSIVDRINSSKISAYINKVRSLINDENN